MWNPNDRVQMLRDLHFALEVMEERSHLGLDNETADTLKRSILNRVAKAEKEIPYQPAAMASELVAEKVLAD